MAREKKPVHKVQMTEGKRNIIRQLLEEYDIESAQDIQDALKDLLGGTIKEMMEAEMDDHLGYSKSERSDSDDYRNGYKTKRVNSSYGSMEIEVPQDRKSTFKPQVVKKRQKDISDIDQKIISMYAKGMTTRQISDQFTIYFLKRKLTAFHLFCRSSISVTAGYCQLFVIMTMNKCTFTVPEDCLYHTSDLFCQLKNNCIIQHLQEPP